MTTAQQAERFAIVHPTRVRLLEAMHEGQALQLESFARALDLPLARVEYHCETLRGAGAVTVDCGRARITELGLELYRRSLRPERRRGRDRRQSGGGRGRRSEDD
jgi:DNA-binding transcriptional ArsR family regulator